MWRCSGGEKQIQSAPLVRRNGSEPAVLLDTTFFIDLAEELQSGARGPCQAFILAHRHVTKRVSVVTMGEYAVGATAKETIRFFRGYQRVALGGDVPRVVKTAGWMAVLRLVSGMDGLSKSHVSRERQRRVRWLGRRRGQERRACRRRRPEDEGLGSSCVRRRRQRERGEQVG
jgi:hypothetical protein